MLYPHNSNLHHTAPDSTHGLTFGCPRHIGAEDPQLFQKVLGLSRISGTDGCLVHQSTVEILAVLCILFIVYGSDDIFIDIPNPVVL